MFCSKCGSKISENDNFCKKCGSPANTNNQIRDNVIKKTSPKKVTMFIILALIIISITFLGLYSKLNSSIKSSSNKILKISSPIPPTNFIKEKDVVFEGNENDIIVWSSISHRKDGLLPTTLHSQPQQAALQVFVLIQNKGNKNISLIPSNFSLILNNDKVLPAFEGEKWDNNFEWLSPEIIELNGQDVSKQYLQQTNLSKNKYCVIEVSFPMDSQLSEQKALSICKKIELVFQKDQKEDTSIEIEKVK